MAQEIKSILRTSTGYTKINPDDTLTEVAAAASVTGSGNTGFILLENANRTPLDKAVLFLELAGTLTIANTGVDIFCPPEGTILWNTVNENMSEDPDANLIVPVITAWVGDTTHVETLNGSGASQFTLALSPNSADRKIKNIVYSYTVTGTNDVSNYWQFEKVVDVPLDSLTASPQTYPSDYWMKTTDSYQFRFTPVGSPGTLNVSIEVTWQWFYVCETGS